MHADVFMLRAIEQTEIENVFLVFNRDNDFVNSQHLFRCATGQDHFGNFERQMQRSSGIFSSSRRKESVSNQLN
jgi:hypothetical protein